MRWAVEDRGHNTSCWIWTGALNDRGYGLATDGHRLAHRAVWVEHNGDVPDGLELDHLCRVRPCVNPDHLEPVTHKENMIRSAVARLSARRDKSALLRARLDMRLSQADTAGRLGVSQSIVGLWERGRVPVPDGLDVAALAWAGGSRPDPVGARRRAVAALWNEGLSSVEIAAEVEVAVSRVISDITIMRRRGVALAYRKADPRRLDSKARELAEGRGDVTEPRDMQTFGRRVA